MTYILYFVDWSTKQF